MRGPGCQRLAERAGGRCKPEQTRQRIHPGGAGDDPDGRGPLSPHERGLRCGAVKQGGNAGISSRPYKGREFFVWRTRLADRTVSRSKRGGTAGADCSRPRHVFAPGAGSFFLPGRLIREGYGDDKHETPPGRNTAHPGPTPVPPAVTEAMTAAMINHRSAQFTELATDVHEGPAGRVQD